MSIPVRAAKYTVRQEERCSAAYNLLLAWQLGRPLPVPPSGPQAHARALPSAHLPRSGNPRSARPRQSTSTRPRKGPAQATLRPARPYLARGCRPPDGGHCQRHRVLRRRAADPSPHTPQGPPNWPKLLTSYRRRRAHCPAQLRLGSLNHSKLRANTKRFQLMCSSSFQPSRCSCP